MLLSKDMRTTRVVTGRQKNSTSSLALSNDVAGGWC